MERCDFSSIITILHKYISDDKEINQVDLLYELFESFLTDKSSQDFDFDNGLVCRWLNGQARISPRISKYYMHENNQEQLAADIEDNILPLMYDSAMAIEDVYRLVIQDNTISDKAKERLTLRYPCNTAADESAFLSSALRFGIERTFVKRNSNTKKLLATGNLSPVVKDFIIFIQHQVFSSIPIVARAEHCQFNRPAF